VSERGKKALERLSRETGGAFFEVSKSEPIEKIYGRIEDALRTQYSIGFVPKDAPQPGRYHKVKLTVDKRDLAIQTRDGYYAK